MPSDLDALIAEFAERGLDDDDLNRLREATAATPLRQELKAANQRAKTLEGKLAKATFQTLGINASPDALRLPDDLDVTDVDKVREWARGVNLIPSEPEVPAEEFEAQERAEQAAATGTPAKGGQITPADAASWSTEKWVRFTRQHPDAADSIKRGVTVTGITF